MAIFFFFEDLKEESKGLKSTRGAKLRKMLKEMGKDN